MSNKRPSYVLRLLAVVALLAMALVGTAATTLASPPPSGGNAAVWDKETYPGLFGANESDVANASIDCFSDVAGDGTIVAGGPECDGAQEVYFAAVSNNVDFGLGASSTSVTVQNIDVNDAYAFIYVGNPGGGYNDPIVAYLSAGASKTFTADSLGIASGDTVPVVAALYQVLVAAVTCTGTGPYVCTYTDAAGAIHSYTSAVDVTAAFGIGAYAAGVAKQAAGTANLPYTSDATTAVSGYNAVSGREVGFFDDLYFPIVQTNCGPGGCWNTILHVANVGIDTNAAITISFFAADNGEGSSQTGFQVQTLLNAGDQWSVDLSSLVPEGWVGTAHVYTDDAVVAIADRYKAGTNMWITNTASNAVSESDWQNLGVTVPTGGIGYVLFAPDVRTDWNGWNMGINVANTVDTDNTVSIQYAGLSGNAPQGLEQRLNPQGMFYFYNPSSPSEDNCNQPADQVPADCGFIGGAVILSEYPVTAAVDGVKYFGNDSNVGQAFSYSATGNLYNFQSAPLVQKGQPSTGMGATSGINFLNPNAGATVVEVRWTNPSGYAASNFADSVVWVPGFATGFVYTMFNHNIPNGFTGAASVASTLPIAATTANVDYAVSGDGTVVWNLYNPCGFFRQNDTCDLGNILGPVVLTSTLNVTVTCPTCTTEDIAGTSITVTGTDVNGYDFSTTVGVDATDCTGAAPDETCTVAISVPAGTFSVSATGPAGLQVTSANPVNVTIAANSTQDVSFTEAPVATPPAQTGTLTKRLLLDPALAQAIASGQLALNSGVAFCQGADLTLADCDPFTTGGSNAHGGFFNFDVIGTDPATGLDYFDFSVSGLPVGDWTICSTAYISGDFGAAAGGTATGTTETVGYAPMCETATVSADTETVVDNNFETLAVGSLDVIVTNATDGTVVTNGTVCARPVATTGPITCAGTDANGVAHIAVQSGRYTTTATAPGFESESTEVDYSVTADITDGTPLMDVATPEVDQQLSPSGAVAAIAVSNNSGNTLPFAYYGVTCDNGFTAYGQTDASGNISLGFTGLTASTDCTVTITDYYGDVLGTSAITVNPNGTQNFTVATTGVAITVQNLLDCNADGSWDYFANNAGSIDLCGSGEQVVAAYDYEQDANQYGYADKDANGQSVLVVPANSTVNIYGYYYTTSLATYLTGSMTGYAAGTDNSFTSVVLQ